MASEEILIDRNRIECIVSELTELLKVETYHQFKLRFAEKDGFQTLTIVPHSIPVEITLNRS